MSGCHAEVSAHVNPRAIGGDHTDKNLVPACTFCNSSKGARVVPGESTSELPWNVASSVVADLDDRRADEQIATGSVPG